jgi:hypothetical protein
VNEDTARICDDDDDEEEDANDVAAWPNEPPPRTPPDVPKSPPSLDDDDDDDAKRTRGREKRTIAAAIAPAPRIRTRCIALLAAPARLRSLNRPRVGRTSPRGI